MRLRFLIPTVFLGLACGGSSADDSLSAGATGGKSGASQAAGKGGGTAANACSELATCCAAISNIQTKKSCEDAQKTLAMKPDLTTCTALLAGYVGQGVCGAGQGAGGAVGAGGAAGSVSAAGMTAAGMGGSVFGGGGGPPMGQGGMPMGQGGFGMGEGGFPGQGGAGGVGPGGTSGGGFAGGPPGGVPKTCEESHGVQGCCTADGKGGYYWESTVFGVTPFTCKAGEVCSWTPGQTLEGLYDCVAGTTPKVDPKGVFPYLCGLPKVEGTCQ